MTITQTYSHDTAGNFTFDSNEIEVTDKARLKKDFRVGDTFTETFDSSTGHTFDSSKLEFSGGLVRQKDQRPTNSILGITYTSSFTTNWLSILAVLNGTPTLVSGKASCIGTQGVTYQNAAISATPTVGAIKFKYTPNYTTAPSTNINIVSITPSSGNNNRILLTNSPSGNNVRLIVSNSTGATVVNTQPIGPAWQPTSGTTYEFELNWDSTIGIFRLFINGVLHGTYNAGAYTRTGTADILTIGATPNVYNAADASFDDVVLFSTVQHTSGYTPGYSLSETIYVEASNTIPAFTGALGENLKPSTLSTTQTSNVRFIVQERYWNGSTWVSSDGTYAQSNTLSDFNTNVASFPDTSSTTLTVKAVMVASNTQQTLSNLDLDYLENKYPLNEHSIFLTSFTAVDGVSVFSSTQTGTVGYIIETRTTLGGNSTYQYWNGSVWVTSNQTLAQSNNGTDLNSAINNLDVASGKYFRVVAILSTADASSTPELDVISFTYSFFAAPTNPSITTIYGWLRRPDGSGVNGTVKFTANTAYEHGDILIPPSSSSTATNSEGYWEIEIYETETVSQTYTVTITYANEEQSTVTYTNITIPDQISSNLNDIIP